MQTKCLVSVDRIPDDETGIYPVGELDFGVPYSTIDWLDGDPSRAKKLAAYMRHLASQCENREFPFNRTAPWRNP